MTTDPGDAPATAASDPAAPTPTVAGRRLPRWWPAAAAVLALVVAVPLVVILLEDDPPERVELPLPSAGGFSGPGGSELASLLVKGRDRTFHATYALTVGEIRQTLEWWNDEGRVRQDTVSAGDGGDVRTASLKLNDKEAVVCRQEPARPWTCEKVAVPVSGDPRGLLANLQAQLSGRPVTVRTDQVNGRDARCFSVAASPGSEAVELCSDPDGIPLRLASPEAKLELTALDDSVPKNIFTPPA